MSCLMSQHSLMRQCRFAYVDFENAADATAAVENLDMQVFEGRNLVVQYHRPKPVRTFRPISNQPTSPPSNTLFLGNMSFEMSDKDIHDLFRDIRNIFEVRVAIDKRTNQPRGFAHAEFIDVASAMKAMEVLRNKVVYGRKLRLDYSTSARSQRGRSAGQIGQTRQTEESSQSHESAKEPRT